MFKSLQPSRLSDLSTSELKRLLQLTINNDLELPLNAVRIACVGFQHRHEALMNSLRDLDSKAVKSILIAVLHERSKWEEQVAQLKKALDRELNRTRNQ